MTVLELIKIIFLNLKMVMTVIKLFFGTLVTVENTLMTHHFVAHRGHIGFVLDDCQLCIGRFDMSPRMTFASQHWHRGSPSTMGGRQVAFSMLGVLVRGLVDLVGHLLTAGAGILHGGLGVEVLISVREVISLDVGEVRLIWREVSVIIFIPRNFVDQLLGMSVSIEEAWLGVSEPSGCNHDVVSSARDRIGLSESVELEWMLCE